MGDAGRAKLGLLLGLALLLALVGGAAVLTFGPGGEPPEMAEVGDEPDRRRVARERTQGATDGDDDWLSRVVPPVERDDTTQGDDGKSQHTSDSLLQREASVETRLVVEEAGAGTGWPPVRASSVAGGRGRSVGSDRAAFSRERPGVGSGEDAPQDPGSLTVRVVAAESGEALSDAVVQVLPHEASAWVERTGAEPQFTDLPDGPVEVRIRHKGRQPVRETGLTARVGRDLVLDVALRRGREVQFEFANARAFGNSEVRVRVWPESQWWRGWPLHPMPVTLTEAVVDENGVARVDGLQQGVPLVAEVSGREVRTMRHRLELGPATEPHMRVDLLQPGTFATGRVVTEDGDPAAGAVVFAVPRNPRAEASWRRETAIERSAEAHWLAQVLQFAERDHYLPWTTPRAITDADGRFVIEGLDAITGPTPFDEHADHAILAVHAEGGSSEPHRVEGLTAGRAVTLPSLRLRGRAKVSVRVRGEADAARRARVRLPSSFFTGRLRHRGNGVFGPLETHVGSVLFDLVHPNGARALLASELRADTHTQFDVAFDGLDKIRGHVIARTAEDLSGVQDFDLGGALIRFGDQTTTSAGDGSFVLHFIRDSCCTPEFVEVSRAGYTSKRVSVHSLSAELSVRLEPTMRPSVRLRLPEDHPRPRWVRWKGSGAETAAEATHVEGWSGGHITVSDVLKRDPWFDLAVDGCASVRVHLPPEALRSSAEPFEVELAPRRRLRGRVEDRFGRGVSSAVVVWYPARKPSVDEPVFVRTGPEGGFELELPTARMKHDWLSVAGFGVAATRIQLHGVEPESAEADVVLRRPLVTARTGRFGGVQLQLDLSDGRPASSAVVDWPGGSAMADAEGRVDVPLDRLPVHLVMRHVDGSGTTRTREHHVTEARFDFSVEGFELFDGR